MTLYHVTMKKNLESIMMHGLIPQIGERSKEVGEESERVYLFPLIGIMRDAVSSWMGEWYEERYGEDVELCALEINVPNGFPIRTDPDWIPFEKYSYQVIPPEYITYLEDV